MRKLKFIGLATILFLVLVACSNNEDNLVETEDLKDGYYHAMGDVTNDGWTEFLSFEVNDGKVTKATYDYYNLLDNESRLKSQLAKDKEYNLPDTAVATYDEQLAAIANYLVENNSYNDIEFNEEGKSDAISKATISYNTVTDLFQAAANNGPVEQGSLTDGYYFGASLQDDQGFIPQVIYVVDYGVIVGAHVDGAKVNEDESVTYKGNLSKEGTYNLPETAVAKYHEQLAAISEYIVKHQGLDKVELNNEGKTDAISKATIVVSDFQEAFANATVQ